MLRKLSCWTILLVFTLSGCWDHTDMKERTIVIGVGVDKVQGDQPILLSAQVVNLGAMKTGQDTTGAGGSGSDKKNAVMVETSGGKSFYDAIHKFSTFSSRHVTLAHNQIVIFGNEFAKSDISGIIDWMARDYQFRMVNWIFVADQTAQAILASQTDQGVIPGIEINRMMINLTQNAFIPPVNRNDFVFGLIGEGKASYAPLIEIESSGPEPTPRIRVERIAVFNKNHLITVLTSEQSQGLLWFSQVKKGSLIVIPAISRQILKPVSIEVANGKTTLRPRRTNRGLVMEMTCTGDGLIREIDDYSINSKSLTLLEKKTNQALKKQVEQTINRARQIKTDFLGYASIIHGEYPKVWHSMETQWEQEFPQVKTEVRFRVKIKLFGLIKDAQLKSNKQGG